MDALGLGDIDHVGGDHQRGIEKEQLGDEVEVAFQGGGVHEDDNDVGPFLDDEVPGYPLLLRGGGQAVGPRQVDDPDLVRVSDMQTFLPLHGLARPVADMLRQPGEHVEDSGLPDVGLARQGHEEAPALRLRHHFAKFRAGGAYQDVLGLAAAQRQPGVRGHDDDPAAAVAQELHPYPRDDPHAGKADGEGPSPGNRADDPLFVLFQ